MKFLVLSSVFPPDIIGGAEVSAANLAKWLVAQGHEVHVLTTATDPGKVCDDKVEDGLHIWRVWMPRAYQQHHFAQAKFWQKPIWHLQDHIDPRNRTIVARVLDAVKPDFINIHVLQGLGYNSLWEIAKRKIPVLYVLPDLSLACIRMGMFKRGKDCVGQCAGCVCSSTYKLAGVKALDRVGFCSPSAANIETLSKYFPVKDWKHKHLLNANRYPAPSKAKWSKSTTLRVLFVGRLHYTKGVHVLLQAVERLAAKHRIELTLVGNGPEEQELRAKYAKAKWCKFTGFLKHQEISNHMAASDVLCIPSIWAENSPGVVIHALGIGLPVLGSNRGGIPELVEDGKNGMLVPPGDVDAWTKALETVLENPQRLEKWRGHALKNARKFDQDYLGEKVLEFIQEIKAGA